MLGEKQRGCGLLADVFFWVFVVQKGWLCIGNGGRLFFTWLGIEIWGLGGNEAAWGVSASRAGVWLGEIMCILCYWWRYLVCVYILAREIVVHAEHFVLLGICKSRE